MHRGGQGKKRIRQELKKLHEERKVRGKKATHLIKVRRRITGAMKKGTR